MTSSSRLTTGVEAGTPPLTHYFLLLRRDGRNARQRRGSKLKGLARGGPWTPCPSAFASGKMGRGARYACPGSPCPSAFPIARTRHPLLCGLRPQQRKAQGYEPNV